MPAPADCGTTASEEDSVVVTRDDARDAARELALAYVEGFMLPSGCSNVDQVAPDKLQRLMMNAAASAGGAMKDRTPGRRVQRIKRLLQGVHTGVRVAQVCSIAVRIVALASLLSGGGIVLPHIG